MFRLSSFPLIFFFCLLFNLESVFFFPLFLCFVLPLWQVRFSLSLSLLCSLLSGFSKKEKKSLVAEEETEGISLPVIVFSLSACLLSLSFCQCFCMCARVCVCVSLSLVGTCVAWNLQQETEDQDFASLTVVQLGLETKKDIWFRVLRIVVCCQGRDLRLLFSR